MLSETSWIFPRCTPSTITRTLPFGSFRFWITVATTPRSQMSSRIGSSIRGSFWAARKILLLVVDSACSRARTELSRPTMNGAIIWGNTTMSRSGTRGRDSRFLVTNGKAMIYPLALSVLKARSLAGFLVQHDRLDAARDNLLVDEALLDVALRGHVVHEIEHQLFEDDPQAARSHVALERLA